MTLSLQGSLRQVLLRDVLEHPCDDAPRQLYADYLLDQDCQADRLRGEFIQLQLHLHKAEPGYVLDTRSAAKVHGHSANPLIRRAWECFESWRSLSHNYQPARDWLIRLFSLTRCELSRGFLTTWHTQAFLFRDIAAEVFAHEPVEQVVMGERIVSLDGKRWTLTPWGAHADPWEDARYGYVPGEYESYAAALAMHSGACVAWGRAQAGLEVSG